MVYFWLALTVVAIAAEAATSELVAIWFMPASLVAMILAVLNVPLWIQIVVFIVLVAAFLILSKRFLRKYLKKSSEANTNTDALIGQTAIVTERFDNLAQCGAVKVNGLEWSARAVADDVTVEKETLVVIRQISGVKLICEPK